MGCIVSTPGSRALKSSHFQRLPELELEGYVHVIEYREETEAQKGYPLGTHTCLLTPQTRSRPSQWHSIHPCYPEWLLQPRQAPAQDLDSARVHFDQV
jgi:hypothetical protein